MKEAKANGLAFEGYMSKQKLNPHASQHNEYKGKYLLLGKLQREIPDPDKISTFVHKSVKERYKRGYKSAPIEAYIAKYGKWPPICS